MGFGLGFLRGFCFLDVEGKAQQPIVVKVAGSNPGSDWDKREMEQDIVDHIEALSIKISLAPI